MHVRRVVEFLVKLDEEGHLAELFVAAAHAEGGRGRVRDETLANIVCFSIFRFNLICQMLS